MTTMWDLVERVAPIGPDIASGQVYDRFTQDADALVIAVVDHDRRPVGLVERNTFIMKMASPYGRALYANRPISTLMDANPIVVDVEADVSAFTHDALNARAAELLKGFLVTDEGRYVGVGSALSLLRHANTHNLRHLILAEQALKARSEFLSVMSHEIRTPLNGVLAVADIVGRELQQESLRPHIDAIAASGGTLLRLLNDALDFFRGDAGNLDLHEDAFDVPGILQEAGALWRARALQAGLTLEIAYEGPEELWALGDAVRIKQVFNNLIGNALKFSTDGVVTVTLKADCEDIYIRLSGAVRDQGPGIPPERLTSIFDPFSQTEEGRAKGGAGLGLSVCKQLVEKMHGSITASSVLGEGACFAFALVLFQLPAPVAATVSAPADEELGASLHVLIADDNATNRFIAENFCRIAGCTSTMVEDGLEAVKMAQTQPFDLVLMDIQMPRMGGIEAMKALRADPRTRHLPIIALTANADPQDAVAYIAQGMDAVVEKPIKAERLFAAMERVMRDAEERTKAA